MSSPVPCLERSHPNSIEESTTQWVRTNRTGLDAWLFPAFRKIEDIEALPIGWDGHNSAKIPETAGSKARGLLSSVRRVALPEPTIFPFSGGGIGIHWQAGDRELQFSVYPDGDVVYLASIDDAGLSRDGNLPKNFAPELETLTRWLVEGW